MREGHRMELLVIDQIPVMRDQPRLVYEEAVSRVGMHEAIAASGEYGVALADMERVVPRAQPDKKISHSLMSANPLPGSNSRRKCAGDSTMTISSVGRTMASSRCPPMAEPSCLPIT